MWVFDPESRSIVEANAAAGALYGYSREEFRGLPLSAIQVDDAGAVSRRHPHATGPNPDALSKSTRPPMASHTAIWRQNWWC